LPLLDDEPHRLRRGALHLPARRSRQNVNLLLREPLAHRIDKELSMQIFGSIGRISDFPFAIFQFSFVEERVHEKVGGKWQMADGKW
jgi:hypothetical protein